VLDRADAGADRRLDAVGALGVGHHPAAGGGRLGDQGGQLVLAEVGAPGIFGGGEHAAAGGHLDDVGAGADQLADLAPQRLGPVDQAVGHAGVVRPEADLLAGREPPAIARQPLE